MRNSNRFRLRGPSPELVDAASAVLAAVAWTALALLLLSTLSTQLGG